MRGKCCSSAIQKKVTETWQLTNQSKLSNATKTSKAIDWIREGGGGAGPKPLTAKKFQVQYPTNNIKLFSHFNTFHF